MIEKYYYVQYFKKVLDQKNFTRHKKIFCEGEPPVEQLKLLRTYRQTDILLLL